MNSTGDSIRIRPLKPADVYQVLEMTRSLKQAPQWQQSAYLASLDPNAALRRVSFIAEEAATGAIVGLAIASLTPPEAELETIAVTAGFQRRGVARRLFDQVAGTLKTADVTFIVLEVRASNAAAEKFYRSLGFAEAGRRRNYYADPVEDAILMRLDFKLDSPSLL
jgi:[ribosomal protein S18]-alanine N-acetyltransferase